MRSAILLISPLIAVTGWASDYPPPIEGDWVVRDFRFHTGDILPELRLHYRTIGNPSGEPILLLHGTNNSGAAFLSEQFAGELFGPGQPLDASSHYLILPDALGAGQSSKPSDGLRTKFPQYKYDDIVQAQYRLVTEHLGVKHLRRIVGNSAGGMQAWMWGEMFPGFMDALQPMASEPAAMAGRNWMMRRMVIDAIRNDPEWKGGDYAEQPRAFRLAQVYYGIATSGGALALYTAAASREKADREIAQRVAQARATDANDVLYQMEASRDYDPSPGLEKIRARVLAINSADDERNPPELGVMEAAMKRIKNGRYVLIPIGPQTRGHGTVGNAKLWRKYLQESLAEE
jgi:homoserine O-acetyltransferase